MYRYVFNIFREFSCIFNHIKNSFKFINDNYIVYINRNLFLINASNYLFIVNIALDE